MILADTSGLLAVFDAGDADHQRAAPYVRSLATPSRLVVASPTIAELGYWFDIRLRPRDQAEALRRLAGAAWRIEHFTPEDLIRAADLVLQYADFPLGTVDALLVAMAERLDIRTVFTLDRRHFGAVRPAHCEAFELVPELP
jgi:predicted nucleic acid-binding protein